MTPLPVGVAGEDDECAPDDDVIGVWAVGEEEEEKDAEVEPSEEGARPEAESVE